MRFSLLGTGSFGKRIQVWSVIIGVFVCAATFFVAGESDVIAADSWTLLNATERGVSKEGGAQGSVVPTYDSDRGIDIFECDYTVQQGAALSVWAKEFPADLGPQTATTIKTVLKLRNAEDADKITIDALLKGDKGSQTVSIPLQSGWISVQKEIDWDTIGSLQTVSFVVTSKDPSPVEGAFFCNVEFKNEIATQSEKKSTPPKATVSSTLKNIITAPAKALLPKEKPEIVPASFNIITARDRAAVPSEGAKASVLPSFDQGLGKDILEFDYSLPGNASVELNLKDFPQELTAKAVNTLRLGMRIPRETAEIISIDLHIMGVNATEQQTLSLKRGWNSFQYAINWEKVGALAGMKLVIKNITEKETAKGTLAITGSFVHRISGGATEEDSLESIYGHMDAGAKGMFNIGDSTATVGVEFDESLGKDVLSFEYDAAMGSYVGVWTQAYPADLNKELADAVRIGVKITDSEKINDLAVKVEIKGTQSTQVIPVDEIGLGWNFTRGQINWNLVGDLKEVVFVTSPKARIDGTQIVKGLIYFDLDFYKLSFIEKYFMWIKLVLIFLLGLVLLLLATMWHARLQERPLAFLSNDAKAPFAQRIVRDLFYGVMIIATIATALYVHSLGTKAFLDAGVSFSFLIVGFIGVLLAEIWKVKFTNRHLTAGEIFQNFVITALFAASSGKQGLLEAPSSWSQIFVVSNVTATVAFLIYHFCNARMLAKNGKHLRAASGAMIVCAPYLFGWLLIVQNQNLLISLSNSLTIGLLGAWPVILKYIGRTLIVFGFNEAVANGLGMVTKGQLLKTRKAHIIVFLVSVGVVIAPLIADIGSGAWVAKLPLLVQALVAILTTMFAYAGLWGEVYLVTGMMLDAGKRTAPNEGTIAEHVSVGTKKAMAYSGFLVALIYLVKMFLSANIMQSFMSSAPLIVGVIAGVLIFPLIKTIIESFDGSLPFIDRMIYSYKNWVLYLRGAIVGFGFAYMVNQGMFESELSERIVFGLFIGLAASLGVSLLRDAIWAVQGKGKIQTWKLYITDGLLGAFVGSAVSFYLDARQVPVVIEKFKLYTSAGFNPIEYITYPLVNKWGRIDLGTYTGGARLLFTESLAGVINWSIAAWLFAINKVFMQAAFDRDKAPIKYFFSRAGFATLIEHMIFVLRWGLWMSPIIFTFLRMMPEATWYNQDGAIRTIICIFNNAAMSPEQFQTWSLNVFIYMLAFDFLRVLIWMDHMGLRVATLVNLSFLGLDRLDEKVAKLIGPAAAQRYIPEGVKRFCTWAPLLIPFYLPRGNDWDKAWNTSIAMQNAQGAGPIATIQALPLGQKIVLGIAAIFAVTVLSYFLRILMNRARRKKVKLIEIANKEYKVTVKESGEIFSEIDHQKRGVFPLTYDLTRRSYDPLHPCGRILFMVDTAQKGTGAPGAWPVAGNFPIDRFEESKVIKNDDSITIVNESNGIKTTINITIPDNENKAEIWNVSIENLTSERRSLKVVPYLEWVLNGGLHDRFHTQYARLFPEMQYVQEVNAVLAWQKGTSSMGVLASDAAPEGFHNSRMDFIGRARTIWNPRILETFDFLEPVNTEKPYPTFDPIGSIVVDASVEAKGRKDIKFLIGYETSKEKAIDLVKKVLEPKASVLEPGKKQKERPFLIGHGEIPAGTPQPYSEYTEDGKVLRVLTPYTTRPYDHAMSNNLAHSVMVTNRGLHTSCNGNSQQNRLTPDWSDTVTKEVPTEAIFLYDEKKDEWFSPCHQPLNDHAATNTCEFSVDGTAVFHMKKETLETELTVFVPQNEPMGVYMLKIKNKGKETRTLRVSPFFEMVLSFMPEQAGSLIKKQDADKGALYFYNPRNMFRKGWAFASMSLAADTCETDRGKYFGKGRGLDRPYLVEKGAPDNDFLNDPGQIAAFVGTLSIPAGQEQTIVVVMGQTDEKRQAEELVRKYKDVDVAKQSLESTRAWWLALMETVKFDSDSSEFNNIQNWLKYQALAERIWARRGFYQTSGAYGFRDQLQDTVNLMWVDPKLARKQIILHASHQFLRGDVYHWFFTLTDGRTAFSCRSHASDNPLWLSWGVAEYVNATGDMSILDEMTSYVFSEFPFANLPKCKHGVGHLYHRSTRSDTVYRHAMRSIDLVLDHRLGRNGLPLIQTGDWNDGLDEIGSEGIGESVWLGFFLYYIVTRLFDTIEAKEGKERRAYYEKRMYEIKEALEATWRGDRYLRAFHDDGTEIGVKGSGIWEIDALTVAWAVYCGINHERETTAFHTALDVLEKNNAVLLGWPALREDSKPYLGRSSKYPEGVRENGMYCHGVQWMIKAARILTERAEEKGDTKKADEYREIAFRLWKKITPVGHVTAEEIEIYGGQPNKQQADVLTNYDRGRMIWNGYTGAAGWLLRQSYEGVIGARLIDNEMIIPDDLEKRRGDVKITGVWRDTSKSPLKIG